MHHRGHAVEWYGARHHNVSLPRSWMSWLRGGSVCPYYSTSQTRGLFSHSSLHLFVARRKSPAPPSKYLSFHPHKPRRHLPPGRIPWHRPCDQLGLLVLLHLLCSSLLQRCSRVLAQSPLGLGRAEPLEQFRAQLPFLQLLARDGADRIFAHHRAGHEVDP